MKELEKIKILVEELEDKIAELEIENRALRSAIHQACNSLMRQNEDYKEALKESEKVIAFAPSFKQPKWKNK
jgi:hypothetical protein|tara:strand:+ start:895 stop:1110 length:216 start_codon:yes stop_codon:yes gene_type:complete